MKYGGYPSRAMSCATWSTPKQVRQARADEGRHGERRRDRVHEPPRAHDRTCGADAPFTSARSSSIDHWSSACTPYFAAMIRPCGATRKSAGSPNGPSATPALGAAEARESAARTAARKPRGSKSARGDVVTPKARIELPRRIRDDVERQLGVDLSKRLGRGVEDRHLTHAGAIEIVLAPDERAQMEAADRAPGVAPHLEVHQLPRIGDPHGAARERNELAGDECVARPKASTGDKRESIDDRGHVVEHERRERSATIPAAGKFRLTTGGRGRIARLRRREGRGRPPTAPRA